jgi:hypothetical protein
MSLYALAVERQSKNVLKSARENEDGTLFKSTDVPQSKTATKSRQNNFELLTKYIPTESITLYIAAMSSLPFIQKGFPFFTSYIFYWFFAIITPLIYLSVSYTKFKQSKKEGLLNKYNLPIWDMFASLVAFLCWALAVPGGPYLNSESGGILASFAALFMAYILGLIDGFIK